MLIQNSLTIHNNKPTFFRKKTKSCIDHIISNCPTNISNVRTHYNNDTINYINTGKNIINNSNPVLSDHAILSCNYNNKHITTPQHYKIIRNNKLLTKHKLKSYFNHNENRFTYFLRQTLTSYIIYLLMNYL